MAQEIDEGISYLAALRQSDAPAAAATASARQSGTVPAGVNHAAAAGVQHAGPEKRRSARFTCEGNLEMREAGRGVSTWAMFTDISMHGCYVEAQATYPAATALEMKLEANGLTVHAKGIVRANYPYMGMGIAFVDLSDENRARLKELLRTVSRPSMIMGPGIASSLPSGGPLESVPMISQPQAAIQALVSFFEDRQMLMREDFLRILRKSQG